MDKCISCRWYDSHEGCMNKDSDKYGQMVDLGSTCGKFSDDYPTYSLEYKGKNK